MRGELTEKARKRAAAAGLPLIRPRAGPRPPSPEGEGLFLFTVPMMHGLQLELKVAGILGKLAREDDTRDKQQQRRHQHKAADDQSREAGHKAGVEVLVQHRDHKADAEHGQHCRQDAEE